MTGSSVNAITQMLSHIDGLREQPLAIAAGAVTLALLAWKASTYKAQTQARPPGPPGNWLFGNAFDVPTVRERLVWAKWKEQYGPLVSLEIFGQLIVMVNTPEMIHQILEKRSSITSDRIRVGFEKSIIGQNNTARLKEARKYVTQTVGKGSLHKYNALVELEVVKLVANLMDIGAKRNNKKDIVAKIRYAIGSIILSMTYGLKSQEKDDPNIRDAELALVPLNIGIKPGAFLVDTFPSLRYVPSWFPGASWKRNVAVWAEDVRRLKDNPISMVKKELEQGIQNESVAHTLLDDPTIDQDREEQIKWACLSMYTGGADTTVSAIHAFLLAMVLNPNVQRKAQEEIDTVIGSSRLPNLNDRASLPYIGAVMDEALRWHSVTPISGSHVLTEEQIVEGYVFPKGTIFLGNIWGIMHDEKHFSKPLEFLPERFLQVNEKGEKDRPTAFLDPWNYAFGFGRRVCPGRDLTVAELWLTIATTLATLNISKARDSEGNEVDPVVDFTSGAICHPVPFDCTIEPRNSRTATMVRDAISILI